jgi:3-deoxy-D-manno-octulosonic acid kinase
VRRSRHGGLLGSVRNDRFLGATRAPRELEISLTLRRLGVATPEIVAYATYPAGPMFRRGDVVSREVPRSRDLAAALAALSRGDSKRVLLEATGQLLASMSLARARHPDLNIKNVLLADNDFGGIEACVLDVDRVWLDKADAGTVLEANLRRFSRSALKWRRLHGLPIEEADLLAIESTARELITLAQ